MFDKETYQLVADMYGAALDESLWTGLLDRMAQAVGAKASAISAVEAIDPGERPLVALSSRFTPEIIEEYLKDYAHHENGDFARALENEAGRSVGDQLFWTTKEAFDTRPDVVFLREKMGVLRRLGMRLNNEKAWFDVITFQYDQSIDMPTQTHHDQVEFFGPHLARIVSMRRSFDALRTRYGAALQMLDKYRTATFLCMPSGLVIHKNSFADLMLDHIPALKMTRDGRLVAEGESANILSDAIRKTSMTIHSEAANPPVLIRLKPLNGLDPILVEVAPLRDGKGEIDQAFRGVIVTAIDPTLHTEVSLKGTQKLYGLTDAEVETATLLVKGMSNPDIADDRNVSIETVKSQVKSLYGKLNVTTRSELVRQAMIVELPIE